MTTVYNAVPLKKYAMIQRWGMLKMRTREEDRYQKWFFKPGPTQRLTNVHVRLSGRANQRYALFFRYYLRAHPRLPRPTPKSNRRWLPITRKMICKPTTMSKTRSVILSSVAPKGGLLLRIGGWAPRIVKAALVVYRGGAPRPKPQ